MYMSRCINSLINICINIQYRYTVLDMNTNMSRCITKMLCLSLLYILLWEQQATPEVPPRPPCPDQAA